MRALRLLEAHGAETSYQRDADSGKRGLVLTVPFATHDGSDMAWKDAVQRDKFGIVHIDWLFCALEESAHFDGDEFVPLRENLQKFRMKPEWFQERGRIGSINIKGYEFCLGDFCLLTTAASEAVGSSFLLMLTRIYSRDGRSGEWGKSRATRRRTTGFSSSFLTAPVLCFQIAVPER